MQPKYTLALTDIKDGFKNWRIWLLLGWQDIKLRYRRSTLGPLWITLSMAVTIYTMGLLYGHLFKMDLKTYYPFLATGMLTWALLATLLNEGTNIFIESENFLKQMKQPYLTFICRAVTRNFIIFFHNILVLIPIYIFLHLNIGFYPLLTLVGLAIVWLNAVAYGTVLAILGTRYRDIAQLISSVIQIIFFLTPIMWPPAVLPERYHYIVKLNPFAQFIEIIRNPLLGLPPSGYAIITTLGVTIIGLVGAFLLFARYRARIVYWL